MHAGRSSKGNLSFRLSVREKPVGSMACTSQNVFFCFCPFFVFLSNLDWANNQSAAWHVLPSKDDCSGKSAHCRHSSSVGRTAILLLPIVRIKNVKPAESSPLPFSRTFPSVTAEDCDVNEEYLQIFENLSWVYPWKVRVYIIETVVQYLETFRIHICSYNI